MKKHIIGDYSGWLRVKLEPSGTIIALPEYVKVELVKTKDARDYFTILEGVHKGKEASVKESNLGTMAMYRGAAKLVFDINKGELSYDSGKVAKAITYSSKPTPKGTHFIQIPDFPHEGGRSYLGKTPYALSWLYLGVGNAVSGNAGNDRYLHTGLGSLGCVTVNPDDWTALYKHVILSRLGDGKNVGTITVV